MQPDGKLVVVGYTATVFQLAVFRYLQNGQPDISFDGDGKAIFSGMFGADAVALQSDGRIVVGGTRVLDFQLAACPYWPTGTRVVNLGGYDSATALLLGGDDQLVVASCSDNRMVASQISTSSANAGPLLFRPDFAGVRACTHRIQFSDASRSKIVLTGQVDSSSIVIALARFQATVNATGLEQAITVEPDPLPTQLAPE